MIPVRRSFNSQGSKSTVWEPLPCSELGPWFLYEWQQPVYDCSGNHMPCVAIPLASTLFLDEMRTTAFCCSVTQVTTYCASPWSHLLSSPCSQYTVRLSKPQYLCSKLSIRFRTCDPNKSQGWRVSSFVTMGLPNARNYHVYEFSFFN